ncbi:hypothetical protein ACFFX0_14855 [Citricoccus parietis]|uniref:Uncharacterized protein n=1 Tax=Citricoccus parietis TaxID=592307 RepID=A0ABV5G0D5_9MICC
MTPSTRSSLDSSRACSAVSSETKAFSAVVKWRSTGSRSASVAAESAETEAATSSCWAVRCRSYFFTASESASTPPWRDMVPLKPSVPPR